MKESLHREPVSVRKAFFAAAATRNLSWRRGVLKKLKSALIENEDLFLGALKKDMDKPPAEAYSSEIGFVLNEIDHALAHLNSWARRRKVRTPFLWFPASSRVVPEPKGVVLIIGPWNYPIGLLLAPLVGALAAGCTAVLKPSELSPESSSALAGVIGGTFDDREVAVVEGKAETAQKLLGEDFDHIFFTGSARVGKIVMAAAARRLTPVTLELGGKNPCVIDREVDLAVAARRIVWGKFFNAGQTCVAPDYLLVPRPLKAPLLEKLRDSIESFYGPDPKESPDYARVINDRHFSRLTGLMGEGEIVIGGEADPAARYLAPTVIDNVAWNHRVMEEEIFGPVLPVLEYESLDEAISAVNARPRPLALYFFSSDRKRRERIIRETSSGGVCFNDTVIHILPPRLPFGGVGRSGMGSYHGRASFDTFTHFKSVMIRSFRLDLSLRYPPYRTPLRTLKKVLRFLR